MRQLAPIIDRALEKLASGWRMLARALPRVIYNLYVDENPDYRVCVLLAGSGRGGTTWLAEIINYDNSFRFMFEPFHKERVPQSRAFVDRQYLRPEENNSAYLDPARNIFSGRLRNGWVDTYNRRLKARRRLVKDIRANLLLAWIRTHFPEIPIVLLLRHPCAVAYSRRKMGWPADLEGTFFSQSALMEDYLEPFHLALSGARTDFERHVIGWCIETYVPLSQFRPGEILVTTYEDCVTSPQTEIKRIFEFLQRPFHDDVLRALRKPSSQSRWNWRSRNASPIIFGENIIDAWQRSVSRDDIDRALGMLRLFGLDVIYGRDPMPNSSSIEQFMRTHNGMVHTTAQREANRGPSWDLSPHVDRGITGTN